ncbi:MAG: SDR family oxidoreductase [Candidatus Accumulibacter sp.]|jgi:UDP-glucose 4-epimerase|nr:SDR family oxidoreductase [Accumulibacter sp.]
MKKSVFITGVYGFLGSWCADFFSASGFDVVGFGYASKKCQCSNLGALSGVVEGAVSARSLNDATERFGVPHALIHCAGGASVAFSYENPREDFLRTVGSTAEVLEFLRRHASVRLVYPSSVAVYGATERVPIVEAQSCAPVSPYGHHKHLAEQLCRAYAEEWKFPAAIVRFFSLYGEGLHKQLLWDACRKAARGNFSFFGAGDETRDWMSVRDAVRLTALAVEHAAPNCPTVNGGTGDGMRVKEMLTEIGRLFDPGLSPVFSGEAKPGDPATQLADVTRLRAWGFEPCVERRAGIAAYVAWFQQKFGEGSRCVA